MIEALFYALAFWPFILILCLSTVLLRESEDDHAMAGVLIILGAAVAWWFYDINPFVAVREHVVAIILCLVLYVVAGGVFTVFRWWAYVNSEEIVERVKKSIEDHLLKGGSAEKWAKSSLNFLRPDLNKGRLSSWFVWWPLHAIWMMTNDSIRTAWRWTYGALRSILERIALASIRRRVK